MFKFRSKVFTGTGTGIPVDLCQLHRKNILYLQDSINIIPIDCHPSYTPSYTLTSLYLMNMKSKHGTIIIEEGPLAK